MLTTVFEPMTLGGLRMSTRGSRAARANSASAEMLSPGAMAPPTYRASAVTRSNVVAVPKSTMHDGPPHRSYAATQLTMRSAPTSWGLSTWMAMPVFTPGSTNIGSMPKNFAIIVEMVPFSGGTTEETMAPSSDHSAPMSCRATMPYSSVVRSRAVARRHDVTSSSPRKMP